MKSVVSVFVYLAAIATVCGEISVGESLEWLADTSASIGIYKVAEVRKEPNQTFQLSFRSEETLKGKPPQSAAASYFVRAFGNAKPTEVEIGDQFLVFLKIDDDESLQVAHLINLTKPQIGSVNTLAINCRFEVLTDQAKIVATVRERIKSHPAKRAFKLREAPGGWGVEVHGGTPAYGVLYGGSACFLRMPDDLKPPKRIK